ncbi:hypothetical protein Dimus_016131 [Dionaea muscipula]
MVLEDQYHFLLNDFVNAISWGGILTLPDRVFEKTPILLEEELDEACGGTFNHVVITQSKVLERINARVAQVVDELMNDAWGNVNAPRRAYSSSMTPQMFIDYHREIMEGIQTLQTLVRSIATTQSLHERRISSLESDMSSVRGTVDRFESHLLGLPPESVPPLARPSRPHPTVPQGPNYNSGNASDSE